MDDYILERETWGGSDDKESDGVNRPSITFDLYLLFLLLYTCTSIMDFVIKFALTF